MLEHQLRAAEAAGIPALVRICGQTPAEVLHALDAGANGIVIPHVLNATQAEDLVRSAHYPPRGRRGIATTARAGRHGMVSLAQHLEDASSEILVIPQIEDAEAVAHTRAIAAVDGIDALFVGPADHSLSLGHPGNPEHPDVARVIDGISADVRNAGLTASTFARNGQEARKLVERGFSMISFSTTSVFSQTLTSLAKELKA